MSAIAREAPRSKSMTKFILATATAAVIALPLIVSAQTTQSSPNRSRVPDATPAPQTTASPEPPARTPPTKGAAPARAYPYPGFDGNPND
jgi:hypothetical protein